MGVAEFLYELQIVVDRVRMRQENHRFQDQRQHRGAISRAGSSCLDPMPQDLAVRLDRKPQIYVVCCKSRLVLCVTEFSAGQEALCCQVLEHRPRPLEVFYFIYDSEKSMCPEKWANDRMKAREREEGRGVFLLRSG